MNARPGAEEHTRHLSAADPPVVPLGKGGRNAIGIAAMSPADDVNRRTILTRKGIGIEHLALVFDLGFRVGLGERFFLGVDDGPIGRILGV